MTLGELEVFTFMTLEEAGLRAPARGQGLKP